MANKTKVFDVAKYELTIPDPASGSDGADVKLTSFKLRELRNDDQEAASDRASAKLPFGRTLTTAMLNNQLIMDSFVEVNGQPVVTPFEAWRAWPATVGDFVMAAFDGLNNAPQAAIKDFRATAFGR